MKILRHQIAAFMAMDRHDVPLEWTDEWMRAVEMAREAMKR